MKPKSNNSSLSLLKKILIFLVKVYRVISVVIFTPLLSSLFGFSSRCRYEATESCSHYAERMLKERATIPALGEILQRVLSCYQFRWQKTR